MAEDDEYKKIYDQSVNVGENSGTVSPTYNNTTINQEVEPELEIVEGPTVEEWQGNKKVTIIARLTKPVSRLSVQAQGQNVTGLGIRRPVTDGASSTVKPGLKKWSNPEAGVVEESFENASGTYEIAAVFTDGPEPVIAHKIER
ncbi:hypothetical protein [Palleronia pelagia]|uniref:hypothetical protein n=1 Tax=Palleronia pelagia TaxID=387096 RepID=UPI0011144D13|nr:hypothetical protein [Palleronia pelagia]